MNGVESTRQWTAFRRLSRAGLAALLVAIVAVGGLVPARTKLERLIDHSAHAQHGWGKIRTGLVKVMGSCMDFNQPVAPIVSRHWAPAVFVFPAKPADPPELGAGRPRPPSDPFAPSRR